jgi:hypothetical protein
VSVAVKLALAVLKLKARLAVSAQELATSTVAQVPRVNLYWNPAVPRQAHDLRGFLMVCPVCPSLAGGLNG